MNHSTIKNTITAVLLLASWSASAQNIGLYARLGPQVAVSTSGAVVFPQTAMGSAANTGTSQLPRTVLAPQARYLVTHDSQGQVTSIVEVSRTRE